MLYTLSLLTATCLAGAPDTFPSYSEPYSYTTSQPQVVQGDVPQAAPQAAPRLRLRDRLRNLFSSHPSMPTNQASPMTSSWLSPSTKAKAGTIEQTGARSAQTFTLRPEEMKLVGHDQDYAWITGKLFRVPGREAGWVVVYAGPDVIDRYGGAVMLNLAPEVTNVREGDLVCIHGQIVGAMPGSSPYAGAYYRVQSIDRVENSSR